MDTTRVELDAEYERMLQLRDEIASLHARAMEEDVGYGASPGGWAPSPGLGHATARRGDPERFPPAERFPAVERELYAERDLFPHVERDRYRVAAARQQPAAALHCQQPAAALHYAETSAASRMSTIPS